MNCCTFCSNEAEKLFSNLTHDIGKLCIKCYLKLHGGCGVCCLSFLPDETIPDVNYQIEAKFIGTGEKNFIVCDHCFDAVRQQLPQMLS